MCRSNDEIELNTKNRHNIDALVTGLSFYKTANEHSPHETILSIVNSELNNVVASLGYRLHPEPVYADLIFIVWIGIYPEYRLQGYAKAALKSWLVN